MLVRVFPALKDPSVSLRSNVHRRLMSVPQSLGFPFSEDSSSSEMCDACGIKINFIGKKSCSRCHFHFCTSCVSVQRPKGPYTCRKCNIFSQSIMERNQLECLTIKDLKYYTRSKDINSPINANHKELVEIILGNQAKCLSDLARKAIAQVQGGEAFGRDFETVDVSRLEPHTSAYSGQPGQTSIGTSVDSETNSSRTGLSGATGGGAGVRVREEDGTGEYSSKRLKKDFDVNMDLSDLESVVQIDELGVKQLKVILKKNCIDFKGCVEKQELTERVKRLWIARQKEKAMEHKLLQEGDQDAESDFLCKVCMDAAVDCVLLECGHMLTCVKCGRQLAECPVCRQYVSRVVHAFRI